MGNNLMARAMYSGTSGATGKWSPTGWKPDSSAVYATLTLVPSGAVKENSPVTSIDSPFNDPDSWAEIPLLVS